MGPSGEPAAAVKLDLAPETEAGAETEGSIWLDPIPGATRVPTVPLEEELAADKLTFIPGGLDDAADVAAPAAGLPPFLRNVVEEENDEELLDFFRRRRETSS
jgi:hypothetical protein